MNNRPNALFQRFQSIGFMPIEIPGLIKDVSFLLKNYQYFTIADNNQELEKLGWGIEIIDNVTYKLITSKEC